MLIDFNKHKDELFNDLVGKLFNAKTRYVVSFGGAGSGKSFSQTQFEIIKLLQKKEKLLVIRKVSTTLKDSVISLFTSILNSWGLNDFYVENKAVQTIKFSNGSEILFKGMDDPEKIKSIAGITRIWIEEATELRQEDFQQLNLRLRGREGLQIFLTLNPIDEENWIKKYFFDTKEVSKDSTIIKTTYSDNKFIDEQYKNVLESYKYIDSNYYKVYALGDWGGITEGRIFPIWERIDNFPQLDNYWFGLDFGFSNDPTAIVKTIKFNGRIYLQEICYQTGLINREIAELLRSNGYSGQFVICDSAEPKSIEELRQNGINAVPADKGKGSIMSGIDYLKTNKVIICGDSPNIVKENRYYQWRELPSSRQTAGKKFDSVPKDWMNHILDATRYAYSLGDINGQSAQQVSISVDDLF